MVEEAGFGTEPMRDALKVAAQHARFAGRQSPVETALDAVLDEVFELPVEQLRVEGLLKSEARWVGFLGSFDLDDQQLIDCSAIPSLDNSGSRVVNDVQ